MEQQTFTPLTPSAERTIHQIFEACCREWSNPVFSGDYDEDETSRPKVNRQE